MTFKEAQSVLIQKVVETVDNFASIKQKRVKNSTEN